MTRLQLRLGFGVTGTLLIVAGIVVAAVSDVGGTWFSGPLIGVGAVAVVVALFPRLFRGNR
ncbi:hypothetical protein [Curtobacterium sp. VKM Ac-2922]|uniref:hypothetical protein n=1 Tax=Curtobacterium sp. VKM Ac-2922 TaxID=2929475 RepID=UPI001FB30219|nr:hypothetical protein [Curtobacterium sp. VKM Ac-2922]MCJ1712918.1 hypothetical protein [Curtobacterium sp. VKM Ac-2922]